MGGSGRNSLSTISAFIRKLQNYDILIKKDYNINSWKDDLRVVLKQAGSKLIPTILNISDNSILNESFLEDINNIILNGEVPNLMQ
jgi:dynein heavy chain